MAHIPLVLTLYLRLPNVRQGQGLDALMLTMSRSKLACLVLAMQDT